MIYLDDYHAAEEIGLRTYRIDEKGMANCYLLIGKESALLIDTGCGAGNLKKCVLKLTDKPVTVAVTHRHPDHIGSVRQFGEYYAHANDLSFVYNLMCLPLFSKFMVKQGGGLVEPCSNLHRRVKVLTMENMKKFDLGNRIVVVRLISGHTSGSVAFVDEKERFIFTGDDVNPHLWMHLPGCTSLEEWLKGAELVMEYLEHGYIAYNGHDAEMQPKEQIENTYSLVKEIISKRKQGQLPKGNGTYHSKEALPEVLYKYKNILQKLTPIG